MEIHSTMYYESQRLPKVSAFVKNHSLLLQPVFQQLLCKAKMRTSTHCVLQHPYAENFIGKPHVWTVDYNLEESKAAIKTIMETQNFCAAPSPAPPGTSASQSPFILVPKTTHLEWAQKVSMVPGAWPPPHLLWAWLAATRRACIDTCLHHGLVCEPSFFPFLNSQEAFLQLQLPCDITKREMHHLYPALAQPGQECYLQKQKESLLSSCAGSSTKYQRLCPCCDFLKGQVALCQGCL
ncbi:Alpha-1,6-mannosylglycoprotein 6-beta-N-acetylglucosaminyltransferase B [Sciurus carolinensis]|uniref:alpha-1,6-mannosyl-glycoprotein 6-beta-N-acetylglucosaminyltransferase n=1 Tax=Sciurus carolinensis TaxID=30640 RepID=A0AA41T457_SCICA|nr:Alpha-1,6-mannosylglycoprotein 6-beta-N-acetylglucosaminyltransferase B [Sciurus carolinensis]